MCANSPFGKCPYTRRLGTKESMGKQRECVYKVIPGTLTVLLENAHTPVDWRPKKVCANYAAFFYPSLHVFLGLSSSCFIGLLLLCCGIEAFFHLLKTSSVLDPPANSTD